MKKILKKHPIMYSILLIIIVAAGAMFIMTKIDEHTTYVENKNVKLKEQKYLNNKVYINDNSEDLQGIIAFKNHKFVFVAEEKVIGDDTASLDGNHKGDQKNINTFLDKNVVQSFEGDFSLGTFDKESKSNRVYTDESKNSDRYTMPVSLDSNQYSEKIKSSDTYSSYKIELKNKHIIVTYDGQGNEKTAKFRLIKKSSYENVESQYSPKKIESSFEKKRPLDNYIPNKESFAEVVGDEFPSCTVKNVQEDGNIDGKFKYKYSVDVVGNTDNETTKYVLPESRLWIGGAYLKDEIITSWVASKINETYPLKEHNIDFSNKSKKTPHFNNEKTQYSKEIANKKTTDNSDAGQLAKQVKNIDPSLKVTNESNIDIPMATQIFDITVGAFTNTSWNKSKEIFSLQDSDVIATNNTDGSYQLYFQGEAYPSVHRYGDVAIYGFIEVGPDIDPTQYEKQIIDLKNMKVIGTTDIAPTHIHDSE